MDQECQDLIFEIAQTIEQVLGFRLFWTTSPFLFRLGRRKRNLLSQAFFEQTIVPKKDGCQFRGIFRKAILRRRLACLFCFEQKVDHRLCPADIFLLGKINQLTQMVRINPPMLTRKRTLSLGTRAFPMVMHGTACVMWQDTKIIHRPFSKTGVQAVKRQLVSARA